MADKTITQLTAIDAPVAADELAAWDASVSGTRKTTVAQLKTVMTDVDINGLTVVGTLDVADSVAVYDASASANRKATVNEIKTLATNVDIVGLTATTPATNDSVVLYDLSATANRKAALSDILALGSGGMDINGLPITTPVSGDFLPFYDISASANRKVTIGDFLIAFGLSGGSGSGKLAVTLSPFAAVFPTSNLPQLSLSNLRPVLGFDAATSESCTWAFAIPTGFSGTLTGKVYWIAASAVSGDVVWTLELEAITAGDAVDLDATTSFDTANSGQTTVLATAGYLAVTSITLTNADAVAAGDYLRVRLARNAASGSDTAAGDANVLFVVIQES